MNSVDAATRFTGSINISQPNPAHGLKKDRRSDPNWPREVVCPTQILFKNERYLPKNGICSSYKGTVTLSDWARETYPISIIFNGVTYSPNLLSGAEEQMKLVDKCNIGEGDNIKNRENSRVY